MSFTAPEIPHGTETILVVEDEEMVRMLICTVLEGYGYQVQLASTAEELAQIQAQARPLDLLLTDVVMPKLSGPQVAEQLQAQYPGLKVLFMSGYTEDAVVRHGVQTAEVAFLQKPFSPTALARKVRELLG
jgi:CheY-like chemotaxis protein